MVKQRVLVNINRNKTKKKKTRRVSAPQSRPGFVGQALRSLGGLGGSSLGAMIGMPTTGGALGTGLGAAISKWLGAGDYVVSQNSVLKAAPTIPAMHSDGQTVTIRHKEFVCSVVGSTGFAVNHELTINPGTPSTFPWLSRIAKNFQQYRIKGAVFHYIPTSGSAINSTNPAIGAVMIQTSYRSDEAAPTSKVEMMNEYWASEGPPNETMAHPLECDPAENPFAIQYVRGNVAVTNPLMYDLGKTFIATYGMPATGNPVGDLWITYDIELRKPVVTSNVAPTTESANVEGTSGTPASLFTSAVVDTGGMPVTVSANTVTFPKGVHGTFQYALVVDHASNFTACDLSGSLTTSNCTEASYERTVIGGTSPTVGVGIRIGYINIPDPSVAATITFGTFTLTPATALLVHFTCTPY